MESIKQLMKRFIMDMQIRGMSNHTQRSYTQHIERFLEFRKRPADEIDESEAREFLINMMREGKVCTATLNGYNAAIRLFFAVTLNRTMNYLQLPRFKVKKTLPEILSREEISRLINGCANVKHKAFFMLAYGSGLRVSEISKLRVNDIDSKAMRLFVKDGKGGKDRYTILSHECLCVLREYWSVYRPKHSNGWLFTGVKNVTHIHDHSIAKAFNTQLERAGIVKDVSIHTLRHCFATHLLEDGVDLFRIKRAARSRKPELDNCVSSFGKHIVGHHKSGGQVRDMTELQDIIKTHRDEFLKNHRVSYRKLKVLNDIENCRTSALGAHIDICDECGFERISYNSCRNRHCPKCQTFAKEEWLEKQKHNLLDIQYFHAVFTVPDTLNIIFMQNQAVMYNLLFRAVSETILGLCADKKFLEAKPGITAILHTWGQNLNYHPHLHCVITGGGLTENNQWVNSRKKFFIPIKVLSKNFRGKFLYYLKRVNLSFHGSVDYLSDERNFSDFVKDLYKKDWVTYCKPPFGNAQKVIEYLGRYTHRVAISNNRIASMNEGKVSFSWRDYSDGNKVKLMTLPADEFIRRFLMHVLPSGFRKIRHFGIFAAKDKSKRIILCKILTRTKFAAAVILSAIDKLKKIFGMHFNLCPVCQTGHLSRASPITATE